MPHIGRRRARRLREFTHLGVSPEPETLQRNLNISEESIFSPRKGQNGVDRRPCECALDGLRLLLDDCAASDRPSILLEGNHGRRSRGGLPPLHCAIHDSDERRVLLLLRRGVPVTCFSSPAVLRGVRPSNGPIAVEAAKAAESASVSSNIGRAACVAAEVVFERKTASGAGPKNRTSSWQVPADLSAIASGANFVRVQNEHGEFWSRFCDQNKARTGARPFAYFAEFEDDRGQTVSFFRESVRANRLRRDAVDTLFRVGYDWDNRVLRLLWMFDTRHKLGGRVSVVAPFSFVKEEADALQLAVRDSLSGEFASQPRRFAIHWGSAARSGGDDSSSHNSLGLSESDDNCAVVGGCAVRDNEASGRDAIHRDGVFGLPQDCLADVLWYLGPRDLCALERVSHSYFRLLSGDLGQRAWLMMIAKFGNPDACVPFPRGNLLQTPKRVLKEYFWQHVHQPGKPHVMILWRGDLRLLSSDIELVRAILSCTVRLVCQRSIATEQGHAFDGVQVRSQTSLGTAARTKNRYLSWRNDNCRVWLTDQSSESNLVEPTSHKDFCTGEHTLVEQLAMKSFQSPSMFVGSWPKMVYGFVHRGRNRCYFVAPRPAWTTADTEKPAPSRLAQVKMYPSGSIVTLKLPPVTEPRFTRIEGMYRLKCVEGDPEDADFVCTPFYEVRPTPLTLPTGTKLSVRNKDYILGCSIPNGVVEVASEWNQAKAEVRGSWLTLLQPLDVLQNAEVEKSFVAAVRDAKGEFLGFAQIESFYHW
jgi:hypothetical protein